MLVLITPDNSRSRAVVDRLTAWAAAGLLRPFVWSPAGAAKAGDHEQAGGDVADGRDEAPVHRLVDGTTCERTPLGDAIHEEVVRLMVLWPVEGEGPEGEYVDHVRRCRELLGDVLQYREIPELTLVGVPLGQEVSPAAIRSAKNLVLVSPEDLASPSPKDANLLPEHPEHWVDVLAVAVAGVGSLWHGTSSDVEIPFDRCLDRLAEVWDAADETPPVQVVRATARMIEGGYLLDHVAVRVLRREGPWPMPRGLEYKPLVWSDDLAGYLAERFISAHPEVFGRKEIAAPALEAVTLPEAIMLILDAIWTFIRTLPARIIWRVLGRFHDKLADSAEGGVRPLGKRVLRWAELHRGDTGEEDVEDPGPPLPEEPGDVDAAWSDLMRLCTGLIDGGELPGCAQVPHLERLGARFVLSDAALVVAHPGQIPSVGVVSQGSIAGPADVRGVDRVRSALAGPGASPSPTGDGAPAPEDPMADSGDEPVDGRQGDRDALDTWHREAGRSLLWAVAREMDDVLKELAADRADQAQLQEEESASLPGTPESDGNGLDELDQGDPERDQASREAIAREDRRDRRRFFGRFFLSTAVAGVLMWFGLRSGEWWGVAGALAVIPIWFISLARAGIRAAKRIGTRRRQQEHDHELELVREMQVAQDGRDERRIMDRYHDLMEWSEIIGRLVHDPWVDAPEAPASPWEPLDAEGLPACMQVARGVVGRGQVAELAKEVSSEVYQGGWLTGVYEDVAEAAGVAYLKGRGLGHAGLVAPRPTADSEVGNPESPRGILLRTLRERTFVSTRQKEHMKEIRRMVAGRDPEIVFPQVRRIDGDSYDGTADDDAVNALPPISAWRPPPGDLAALADFVQPAVVRVLRGDGGGSGFIIAGTTKIVTNAHVVRECTEVQVHFDNGDVVTGSVLAKSPTTDLAVVAIQSPFPEGIHGVQLGEWEAVRQGHAVFSLGFAKLLAGEPTLSKGIVSATERIESWKGFRNIRALQHDAAIAGGSSGSPLFDMRGRVIGVNAASNHDSNYINYAVPIDEVHALLESMDIAEGMFGPPLPSEEDLPPVFEVPEPAPTDEAITDYLDELRVVDPAEELHLLHDSWKVFGVDPAEASMVLRDPPSIVTPILATDDTRAYGCPWRTGVHRIDFAAVCSASALVATRLDDESIVPEGGDADGSVGPDGEEEALT